MVLLHKEGIYGTELACCHRAIFVCVYRQVILILGPSLLVLQGLSGLPMHFLAYNYASKLCATGDRGWLGPCSRLLHLGSVGKSIRPGDPQHSPSASGCSSDPSSSPRPPLPARGQRGPQGHRQSPCSPPMQHRGLRVVWAALREGARAEAANPAIPRDVVLYLGTVSRCYSRPCVCM